MQTADRLFLILQEKTTLLVSAEEEKAKSQYDTSVMTYKMFITLFITLLASAFIVGIILSLFMSNRVISPLNEAIAFAQRISKGDLTEKIFVGCNDETGILLKVLSEMQYNLRDIIFSITTSSAQLAQISSVLTKSSGNLVHQVSSASQQLQWPLRSKK